MKTTPWSPSISLRILVKDGKRTLQQRWTRIVTHAIVTSPSSQPEMEIEEKWEDVPTVTELK